MTDTKITISRQSCEEWGWEIEIKEGNSRYTDWGHCIADVQEAWKEATEEVDKFMSTRKMPQGEGRT